MRSSTWATFVRVVDTAAAVVQQSFTAAVEAAVIPVTEATNRPAVQVGSWPSTVAASRGALQLAVRSSCSARDPPS